MKEARQRTNASRRYISRWEPSRNGAYETKNVTLLLSCTITSMSSPSEREKYAGLTARAGTPIGHLFLRSYYTLPDINCRRYLQREEKCSFSQRLITLPSRPPARPR